VDGAQVERVPSGPERYLLGTLQVHSQAGLRGTSARDSNYQGTPKAEDTVSCTWWTPASSKFSPSGVLIRC
jgi:hypothetical protein